ncbi:uncharacterized protein B0T23DRAFT_407719 [Neurospora hispaniola]|uniref:Meiotic recombination protein DMC1 n=1 Tax=Neurospora hispaniola TaxID=588809 RepID=A0AAJ0MMX8_9PEZI|nr:hypothetical protein B0T23DRAFT_407719 [Neurospora hispaniola]
MAENETPNPPTAPAPGGFVPPAISSNSLPSPAPSSASAAAVSNLPHPRRTSLRPGSIKEDKVRNYVSDKMLHISRRYVKHFAIPHPDDEITGYKSMAELCKDVDDVINIIWLSGTPSLQIPYLLNIASEFTTWLEGFPPSPAATFALLRKLDHCFASLLFGYDIDTKETLPGFENGLRAGLSRTDMVRCKSVIERTRVLVVEVMAKEPADEDPDGDTGGQGIQTPKPDNDTEAEAESDRLPEMSDFDDGDDDDEDELLHMNVAQVYENTLVKLGEILGDGGGVTTMPMSVD